MQGTSAGRDTNQGTTKGPTDGRERSCHSPLQQLERLRAENEALREQNRRLLLTLRRTVAEEEKENEKAGKGQLPTSLGTSSTRERGVCSRRAPTSMGALPPPASCSHCLTNTEVGRYSRHLILPEFGIAGQMSLKKGSVLVVGAGGLGAPVVLYLAAAGVSKIGIMDHDTVDVSNLHRQVIHNEARKGTSKAKSAAISAERLNSGICCIPYVVILDSSNAMEVFVDYDVIVDCTDNPATRYLINDACVLLGKPLVSASALRTDGQLSVLNFQGGPCYRCLFPKPPPPEAVVRCGDGGVLGVVPGIMGCLEALEAIKVLVHLHAAASGSASQLPTVQQGLLLFSAFQQPTFRSVRMRGRNPSCSICGDAPTITGLLPDYSAACGGGPASDAPVGLTILRRDERASPWDLAEAYRRDRSMTILDVREPAHFDICRLEGSVNVPLKELEKRIAEVRLMAKNANQVFVVCRRGNDSQVAVRMIRDHGVSNVRDVVGGLTAWSEEVDPQFPTY